MLSKITLGFRNTKDCKLEKLGIEMRTYGISHDRGGHFVPFSVIFAQKLRFEE